MLLYDSVHSSNDPVFSIILVIVKVVLNHSPHAMGLIHYSCAPLILFHFPYTLDSLPQYLPFANGAGGVGIF